MERRLKLALSICAGVTGLSANAAQAQQIVFNVFTGPSHFIQQPLRAWAKDIETATSGRVTVKFLPTSAAPPPKQIDAVVSGQFDAAFIFQGFTAKRAVGPQFGTLPFMLNGDAEAGSIAYWRAYDKYFGAKKEFSNVGLRVLSMFQFGGGNFYSGTDTPISTVKEMRTRKMWAIAGAPSQTMKAAGVNHVSGPAVRVSEFTQTNVVDGLVGIPLEAITAYGALSFTKSATITPISITAPAFTMFISENKWKQFSATDQKAIMAASGEKIARAVGKRAAQAEVEAREKMTKAGVKFVEGSEAFQSELVRAGQPLVEDWIKKAKSKGVDGKAVIDSYKAEVKKIMAAKK